ncbi:MAG: 50S ribosomal protein L11 methyltransferase [Bacteroidetes bacterium]|nr:50S ribosomal protein L11 methyltransferase [Bacteroidota bacterium]
MPKQFFVVKLTAPEESYDSINTSISDLDGFLGLEEGFDELKLSFSAELQTLEGLTLWLENLKTELLFEDDDWQISWTISKEDEQNWNAQWEATIEPVYIGDTFCIYPTWHPAEKQVPVMICIDPKMSFGTGYHETTRLMLQMMKTLDMTNKTTVDCGTGTGVLAIAAKKLGTGKTLAFDLDTWSFENSKENIVLNLDESDIDLRFGGYEVISSSETFDIILANVNKNVHLTYVDWYQEHLNPGGVVLLSGLLKYDEADIKRAFTKAGFSSFSITAENEWIGVEVRK